MSDENKEEVVEQPESQVEEKVEEPATEEPEKKPHPLEPGGPRFADVYARMREAERRAQEMEAQLAAERAKATPQQQQPQGQFYTPQQLQAAKDLGQITEAQMMDQLAWQRAELKAREVEKRQADRFVADTALSEVDAYIAKIPALADANSPELRKVGVAAREIALEMGKPVTDPLVQRRALREVYGSLEKVNSVRKVQAEARANAESHLESTPGAGVVSQRKDPFKEVPPAIKEHWKRLNYTEEQMKAELPYIRPRRTR